MRGHSGSTRAARRPLHCRASGRQVFSPHAVALSLRASLPAHPGPHGRGVGGAVPPDLPADGGRRRAVASSSRPRPSGGASATRSRAPSSRRSSGRSASRSTAPIRTRWRRPRDSSPSITGPEFIDINFGCPVKKVVQRNGGSGCLRDLDLVERIIRAVIGATHLPVTVKTRSGWSDEQRDPVGIALRMQDAGARAFTLHARTRTQMFSGKAQLGRDRARGRGARHSGHRQRRRRRPPRTSSACATTPAAPAS